MHETSGHAKFAKEQNIVSNKTSGHAEFESHPVQSKTPPI